MFDGGTNMKLFHALSMVILLMPISALAIDIDSKKPAQVNEGKIFSGFRSELEEAREQIQAKRNPSSEVKENSDEEIFTEEAFDDELFTEEFFDEESGKKESATEEVVNEESVSEEKSPAASSKAPISMNMVVTIETPKAAPKEKIQKKPAAPAPAVKEEYVECIVCHEKILKEDGFQIAPKTNWYVKKHSPCACEYYQNWAKKQNTSFLQTAYKRQVCEVSMDKKYAIDTCEICGKPINGACGAVATWQDEKGQHKGHEDCLAKQRYEQSASQLLNNLAISKDYCSGIFFQLQERNKAKKELENTLKQYAAQPQAQPAVLPVASVITHTQDYNKINKELRVFKKRHQKELADAQAAQQEGKTLTKRQQRLMNRLEKMQQEYNEAVKEMKGKK